MYVLVDTNCLYVLCKIVGIFLLLTLNLLDFLYI